MPRVVERDRPTVVRDLGEQVQVRPRRGRVELIGRTCGDAHRPTEVVVFGQQVLVLAVVFVGEGLPLGPIGDREPGQDGRQVGVPHLEGVRRDEAHPRRAGELHRRVARDVVGADHVGADVVPDLHDPLVRVPLAGDERLPDRLRHGLDLLDGRPAELGRRDADELRPRVGVRIGRLVGRRHPHDPLLEPAAFQLAAERLVHHEDDALAAFAQDVRDRDAVVGRAPGPGLGEEGEGLHVVAHGPVSSRSGTITFYRPRSERATRAPRIRGGPPL